MLPGRGQPTSDVLADAAAEPMRGRFIGFSLNSLIWGEAA
jgi:hypothetical protein